MPSRGGSRASNSRDVQVSKKLSWLLRHGAEKEHLTLGPGGFVPVDQVLANRNLRSLKVTFAELQEIVRDNSKQRFTMVIAPASAAEYDQAEEVTGQAKIPSDDPRDYLIRANQGHSLKVDMEGLLKPITEENAPGMVVHGTTRAAWWLIAQSGGLKPMGRTHVHFATGLPASFHDITDSTNTVETVPVVSGMRNSSTVLMFLDVSKALDTGIKLAISDNGVVLSEGNEQGIVPLEVFKRVQDRTGQEVLLEDGRIIKDTPASWAPKGARR